MRTLVLLGVLSLPLSAIAQSEPIGRAVVVRGEVVVNRSGTQVPVQPGDTLLVNDIVETREASLAHVLLTDKSLINLGPRSRIALTGLERTEAKPRMSVKLFIGRVWARVARSLASDSTFEVATENAVAGVRGTSFFAEFADGESRFAVDNGTVEVESEGVKEVLTRLMRSSVRGGEQVVETIPPGELEAYEQELAALPGLPAGEAQARLERLLRSLGQSGTTGSSLGGRFGPNSPPLDLDPGASQTRARVRGRIEVQD